MISASDLLEVAGSYSHQEDSLEAMVAEFRRKLGTDPFVVKIPVEGMNKMDQRHYGPHMVSGTEFECEGSQYLVLANWEEAGYRFFIYDRLSSAIAA